MATISGEVPAAEPIRVFLVDDHRTFLWGLERLIEAANPAMTVVGNATNRSELFARLPSTTADVIVLDLDLNGDNALDWLHELLEQSDARILLLASSSNTSMHQQGVIQGARGVVHKQEPPEVIVRAIEKIHSGEIWLDRNSLGHVVHVLSRGQKMDPDTMKVETLTPRQRRIIATILREKGARNKVIAEKLHISEHTLRNNLTSIYSKLEVNGRLELYLYASSLRFPLLH